MDSSQGPALAPRSRQAPPLTRNGLTEVKQFPCEVLAERATQDRFRRQGPVERSMGTRRTGECATGEGSEETGWGVRVHGTVPPQTTVDGSPVSLSYQARFYFTFGNPKRKV